MIQQKEKLLDRQVFKLLMAIKDQIQPPEAIGWMKKEELIAYIVDQIKEIGDQLNTPLFRINNCFAIYFNGTRLDVHKKGFQEFLAWVGKHIGVDDEIVYDIPFRNQLFGRAWRELKPEE